MRTGAATRGPRDALSFILLPLVLALLAGVPGGCSHKKSHDSAWFAKSSRTESFLDALSENAARQDEYLVLVSTADWCRACSRLADETLVDAEIEEWFSERGRIVLVDQGDEEDVLDAFSVNHFPTLIAFQGGEEIDRTVGARSPAELLSWLDGLESGEKYLDRIRAAAEAEPDDLRKQRELARALLHDGNFEMAAEVYVRVWNQAWVPKADPAHDESFLVLLNTFMLSEMAQVAAIHEAAYAEFLKLPGINRRRFDRRVRRAKDDASKVSVRRR